MTAEKRSERERVELLRAMQFDPLTVGEPCLGLSRLPRKRDWARTPSWPRGTEVAEPGKSVTPRRTILRHSEAMVRDGPYAGSLEPRDPEKRD